MASTSQRSAEAWDRRRYVLWRFAERDPSFTAEAVDKAEEVAVAEMRTSLSALDAVEDALSLLELVASSNVAAAARDLLAATQEVRFVSLRHAFDADVSLELQVLQANDLKTARDKVDRFREELIARIRAELALEL